MNARGWSAYGIRARRRNGKSVITGSRDEKPGVQAIENTAPDLAPVPGQHSTFRRDHEYKRHGTLSILAAVDLHNGEVIAQVHPRHRSREFILLLKEIDEHYPKECTLRVILDNHSAHISKETMAYLAWRAPSSRQYASRLARNSSSASCKAGVR